MFMMQTSTISGMNTCNVPTVIYYNQMYCESDQPDFVMLWSSDMVWHMKLFFLYFQSCLAEGTWQRKVDRAVLMLWPTAPPALTAAK